MFTGLISDIGIVEDINGGRVRIACHYDAQTIETGASIACDGCCLTAINIVDVSEEKTTFEVDVSNETFECTTLKSWKPGQMINLERSLKAGDELGGHIVSGHVDGIAKITDTYSDGDSKRFVFSIPEELKKFVASKGSVAINGTSLTVNEVEDDTFGVNLIPHTLIATTWGKRKIGDQVNIEVDLLARYVSRISSFNN